MKAWIHTRRHFTSEVGKKEGYTNVDNRRMLPDVDPSAWMSFLLPWHTLAYYVISMPWPLPSYWLRLLSMRRKMNMFIFCRSRIEAESKSNRNCNSRLKAIVNTSWHVLQYQPFALIQNLYKNELPATVWALSSSPLFSHKVVNCDVDIYTIIMACIS